MGREDQWYRGPEGAEDQRNSGKRGSEGTDDQGNSGN